MGALWSCCSSLSSGNSGSKWTAVLMERILSGEQDNRSVKGLARAVNKQSKLSANGRTDTEHRFLKNFHSLVCTVQVLEPVHVRQI
eukprot:3426284-Amphidinium_carterae.1